MFGGLMILRSLKNILTKTIILIFIVSVIFIGCDIFPKEEIPPEKLPPVPEKCIPLSNQYTHALMVAYTSAEASQLQVTRVANMFDQCMEEAGLSKAEAKGIIKNIEKTTREKADKSPGQDGDIYR
jgi:hypothetical protein